MVPIMSSSKKSRASKQKPQEAPAQPKSAVATPSQERPVDKPATGNPTTEAHPVEPVAVSNKKFSWTPSIPTLLLLGILAIGLVFRLLTAAFSIKNGHVMFAEFDPYYHLRRITYIVHNFPFANVFDPYVNYPNGYYVGWPPLFDVLGATLAMIVGLGHPDQFTIEMVSALLPVVLGVLAIAVAYVFVKDIFNVKAALLAAFVMAILPASIFRATFGYTDHQVMEVLLSLTLYVLFMRAVTRAKAQGLTLKNLTQKKEPVIYAALAGIAIAAMIFTWDGAPLLIGVILLYALLQYTADAWGKERSEYLSIVGTVAAVVGMLIVVPAAITSYHGMRFEISAIYLSLFQAIFMVGLVGFFLCMEGLRRAISRAKLPWVVLPAAIVIIGATGTLFVKTLLPQIYSNLEGGISFLTGADQFGSSINEVTPLFYWGGEFSLALPAAFLNTAALIAIVGVVWFLYSFLKSKPDRNHIFFLAWSLVIITLGLLQSRFIYLLGACVSVYAGYAMYRILSVAGLDRLLEQFHKARENDWGKNLVRASPALVITAVILLLLLVPVVQASYQRFTTPEVYTMDWNEAALWLKDHSPATSYTYSANMSAMPEYSVMNWWDDGNFILYRAERPAVANNFQTGISDSAGFFVAQNETAANLIMDSRNSRYVMLDKRMGSNTIGAFYAGGTFETMALLAGEDLYSYFMLYYVPQPYSLEKAPVEGNDKYYSTMYSRLFYGLGLGGMNPLGGLQNGLAHYRLLYVSGGTDPVMVFEYVKGATITGTAQPGARVEITTDVTVGNATKVYDSVTKADASGAYSFTVPFSTGMTGYVHTGSEYIITSGTGSIKVQVPEDAVSGGKTINAGGM